MKNPEVYLVHILESIEKVDEYVLDMKEDDFYTDLKT